MDRLLLTTEQAHDVDLIVNAPAQAALLASGLGSGKTVISVEAALNAASQATSIIVVICPLSTRIGWERTFRRQGYEGPIVRVDGSKKGKENWVALNVRSPGVYIIGREYYKRLDWRRAKPTIVIADECHFASNRNTLAFKKLQHIKPTRLKIAVSGTWTGNRFEGAWAVTRWLWPDVIDRSFWRWVAQWTRTETQHFGSGEVVKVVGEKNPGAYVKSLPLYIRRATKMNTEYVEETRYVELTPTQRKVYDQMERDSLMWLEENPSVAEVPIVQRIRLRQITLGVPTFNEDDEIDFADDAKSTKIDALKEILNEEPEEPFLILTDSAKFARMLAKRLGPEARAWTGQAKHAEREDMLHSFGAEFKYLVATIPSVAEGVDGLQALCARVVWMNKADSRLLNDQAAARLHRTGQRRDVMAYVLEAVDTLDGGQYANLELASRAMERSLNHEHH